VAAIANGETPPHALALGVAAGAANTLTPGPGVVDPPTVWGLRAQVVVRSVDD
jgi:fructose-1-phosphate kinase PfkB-like protein